MNLLRLYANLGVGIGKTKSTKGTSPTTLKANKLKTPLFRSLLPYKLAPFSDFLGLPSQDDPN